MPNRKTDFARQLRIQMTDAERRLWRHLRAHRLSGIKFKRQQPVGPFIVDFVCFQSRLVIELDGGQHFRNDHDRIRDAWLQQRGFRVLRFWNNEVLGNLDGVVQKIMMEIGGSTPPLPGPLPQGEREKT